MSLGQLLSELLGWLGDFVRWLTGWCPRYVIVACNEWGVAYPRGSDALALGRGVHWYVPNLTRVVKHPSSWYVIDVESISVETKDGVAAQVGCALTLRIVDVLKYEVENYSADSNIDEVAQGALQDIVSAHDWAELRKPTGEETRLGGKLARRMGSDLARFGVEVQSVRPTDQVRLSRTIRLFGHPVQVLQEPTHPQESGV